MNSSPPSVTQLEQDSCLRTWEAAKDPSSGMVPGTKATKSSGKMGRIYLKKIIITSSERAESRRVAVSLVVCM